jgi:hypothetical protein
VEAVKPLTATELVEVVELHLMTDIPPSPEVRSAFAAALGLPCPLPEGIHHDDDPAC